VTSVNANLTVQRGLAQATIVGASAPRKVKAGRKLTVRLFVHRYRGRTQKLSFKLPIPRGERGHVVVTISGPSSSGGPGLIGSAADLTNAFAAALGGPGPAVPEPAASLGQLRARIAGISSYDGLLAAFDGGPSERPYRDPALLINGSVELPLTISG
jgi:hypothetical protein